MRATSLAWVMCVLPACGWAEDSDWKDRFSVHGQATTVTQEHGNERVPSYAVEGGNTLSGYQETRTSFTSTLFAGAKVIDGTEIYVNPEGQAGSGLSQTHGVAGFPNGEIYRVDTPDLKFNWSRIFLRQVIGLGGEREKVEGAANQVPASYAVQRITIVAGKFALNDYFDNNQYAHDPRAQFLNWTMMDNGAWDYAADTRGYSIGFMIEYNQKDFAVRFASVMEPKYANQMEMDDNIAHAHGDNLELEYRYSIREHPGRARLLGYMNHAHMGDYDQSVQNPTSSGVDITSTRAYRVKYGAGLNLEQEISPALGVFSRIGWNDGHTETWAFTEIDFTASAGLSWKPFSARDDRLGLGLVYNEISPEHRGYLQAGGLGFIIGDGGLNYAPEEIVESYYSFRVCPSFAATADAQFVNNPGYNRDHGPAAIVALRLHTEI